MSEIAEPVPVWLDCDPGLDDAFAILLAAYSPQINLLGISIVHGNDSVEHCAKNALRMLWACGVKGVPVYEGVQVPLTRDPKFCPEIHGIPGVDGVAGMCGYHFPDHEIFGKEYSTKETHGVIAMAQAIKKHPSKVTVVLTGAQTSFAVCLRMFPEVKENVEKIVFMGGAIGLGNTGVAAEYNMLIDPEAASIVVHSGIPIIMVPLEVTHKVLVGPSILQKISAIDNHSLAELIMEQSHKQNGNVHPHGHVEYDDVYESVERHLIMKSLNGHANGHSNGTTKFTSQFAEMCYQLLTFFRGTYLREFGFVSPPLHDPCTIFYLTHPQCFKTIDVFVDIDCVSEKCAGRTLCDVFNLSKKPANVSVCTDINVPAFWTRMLQCVKLAADASPMKKY